MNFWDDPLQYKKTRKKKYIITAHMPPMGTTVYNPLEKVSYTTNLNKRIVLTGTANEQWVIDFEKLCKTYTFLNGDIITKERLRDKMEKYSLDFGDIQSEIIKPFKIKTKSGVENFAIHIPLKYKFSIKTSWGEVLQVNSKGVPHKNGDYIVCSVKDGKPDLNDRWVVNGYIFSDTYDMRAFKN